MGKRDEALHGVGGSLGHRYVTIFKLLACLAVNIRQIAVIVKQFFIFQKHFNDKLRCLSKRT